MDIAVIGSGIAGLSAAYCLSRRHRVTLYEADTRIGGHTHTVEVPRADGGVQPVDTGWIVFNARNYPNLSALFGELGVRTRPTRMSFGVSLGGGAYEYMGSERLWTVFAQPSNLLRPSHLRLLVDVLRLNARCRRLLRDDRLPDGTLGAFLAASGLSPQLASRYLLPMAGMIWSCSPRQAMDYPAADFMRFFDAHALFTATEQPVWHTVVGGSHQYLRPLRETFARNGGQLRIGAPVRALHRNADGVQVRTDDEWHRYERVVCAVHSDQALALLDDADGAERSVLGGIPYTDSECVLHTDTSFLPRRRAAWASWNYLHARDEVHDRPICGSYWMNGLQGIEGPVQYVVTLNPTRPVPQAQRLFRTRYQHPHYGPASVRSHAELAGIQGRGGLWFAGAWTGYGFHEDGLRSGLRAVRGIDPACLPDWAQP